MSGRTAQAGEARRLGTRFLSFPVRGRDRVKLLDRCQGQHARVTDPIYDPIQPAFLEVLGVVGMLREMR